MHKAAAKALFDRQAGFQPDLLAERQWEVLSKEFPILQVVFNSAARMPLHLRLSCPDWNDLPPSIALLDLEGRYLSVIPRDPGGVFNPGPHPTTGKPFICMRGALEYHIHPSHVNDPWEQLRGRSAYDLGGILTQVWHAWRKANP
jgi:putative metal binding uncharacterized protein